MIIPIVAGDGERIAFDTDGSALRALAEACAEIAPVLWEWLDEGQRRQVQVSPAVCRETST